MPVAPSFDDLLALGQAEAQTRRADLKFRAGDITVAQLHGSAAMADRVVQYAAEAFRDTFYDGARGDALDTLITDRIDGLTRQPATEATGAVTFSRTTGGGAGTIPLGTQVGTAFDPSGEQVVFTTDADISVGAGANGPFAVNVTAAEAGSAGVVDAGKVNQVLAVLFDTFTVTNAAATGGGNEEESDSDYVRRARLYPQSLRRGTLAALEYGALLIPEVRNAHAVENPTTFAVTVLISDENGSSSLQMVADVAAELENYRAGGVPVTVAGGTQQLVDIAVKLDKVKPGFDTFNAAATIITSVTERIDRLKTSETLYLDSIIAAVIAVAPEDIFDVSFTSIAKAGVAQSIADVVPSSTVTLRTGTITVAGPT